MADATACRIGHEDQRTGWKPASRVRYAGLRPPLTLTSSRNIAVSTHLNFNRGYLRDIPLGQTPMSITTVFTNNRSQAVRLPADVRLPEGVKKVHVSARHGPDHLA